MTVARLRPGSVSGTVAPPPSKSYTHRALIAGHFAGRAYRVERPLVAADTLATARGLLPIGSTVEIDEGRWTIRPGAPPTPSSRRTIDCGESGTTLRLLAATAAATPGSFRFLGRGRLPERPMGPLLRALRTLGTSVVEEANGRRTLPFVLQGPLHGGSVALDASESSQFTSALLLTLPTVHPSSSIRVRGNEVSRPYVDATVAVLRHHKVRVGLHPRRYTVPGGQTYRGSSFRVPGDASSAAYLWASAAVAGGPVTVRNLPSTWPQADLAILDLLEQFGAEVRRTRDGATVRTAERRPFDADLTATPDLYPLAGVLAATAPGRTWLRGAPQVVGKESDRRASTVRLVRALGGRARATRQGLRIEGTSRPRGFVIRGIHDHRVAMSAAVGALAADGPSSVADARSVGKSYPGFWETLMEISGGGPRG